MKKPVRRPRFVGLHPVQVAVIRRGMGTSDIRRAMGIA